MRMFNSAYKNKSEMESSLRRDKEATAVNGSCDDSNILNCPKILTGLSHEVRTYMNSIVAFSFLQNNDNCGASERKEYTDHILNSCDQLITLFDNFLDSALIDAEQPRTNLKKRDIRRVLQDLSVEFNASLSRFDKNRISLVLEEQVDKDEVYMDEEKISRVMKNLFHNALEHTTSGYIKLGYTKRDSQVIFYVTDSGNGYHLNKELLSSDNLTQFLTRNHNTFTTVGLILAQKLVHSMGGTLWIEPNGVNGTGMYFSVQNRKVFQPPENETEEIKSRIAI